jgi:hypothetical protein
LSTADDQQDSDVRTRRRCHRCGVRGHLRLDCINPRRPRRRSVPFESESSTFNCNRVTVVDDSTRRPPIIGGPADGGATGASKSCRVQVATADQQPTTRKSPGQVRCHASTRIVNERRRVRSRQINRTTATYDQPSSSTQRGLADGATKSCSERTSDERVATLPQRPTSRSFNCGTTRGSTWMMADALDNERRTVTCSRTTSTVNEPGSPLIGGPADGSMVRFGRSCRQR